MTTTPVTDAPIDSWPGPITAITLFVEDLDGSKRFYREVFGLQVRFEDANSAVCHFGNTMIDLLTTTAATDLIDPASVATPEAGTRLQLTIEVPDVDEICSVLAERGATLLNGPMDRPWGLRTASFRDPAGHIWEIAH